MTAIRLTQFARGGGCACKIPPGELEAIVAGLTGAQTSGGLLLVGEAPGGTVIGEVVAVGKHAIEVR